MTMKSELSYLQLSLSPNAAIPSPLCWSPVNSLFPFEAFCRIAQLLFIQKGAKFQLCTDALRVRYVELMSSHFASNSKQLLLAVFGAMGPDFDNCPLRILQQSKLIRQNLGLPLCEASNNTVIFKAFDQSYGLKKRKHASTTSSSETKSAIQGQSAPPAPKRVAISVPIVVSQNENLTSGQSKQTLLKLPISKAILASGSNEHTAPLLVKTTAIHDNAAASRIKNGVTAETEKLRGWKAATEEALSKFNLPPLSSNGALITLARCMEHCGTQVSYKNPQFMQGILAGISVAIKSWEEQQNRNKASCGFNAFSDKSIWSTGHKNLSAQPLQHVAQPQSLCGPYPFAQPPQHIVPRSSGYQFPTMESSQNHLMQYANYQYTMVQMSQTQAGLQLPPFNHQSVQTLCPPSPLVAHTSQYSASQNMFQQLPNGWGGAQPPEPTLTPFQPPLSPGPAL